MTAFFLLTAAASLATDQRGVQLRRVAWAIVMLCAAVVCATVEKG